MTGVWLATMLGVVLGTQRAAPESPAAGAFVTTQGRDTISIERYARRGSTITGDWVSNPGPAETRRVASLDMAGLVAGFVAAHAAAAAAHVEIAVPATALQRLVGEYPLDARRTFVVTRDGERLFVRATGQPPVELFAESTTRFFAKAANLQVEFPTDATGDATAIVLVRNGTRERAGRKR